MPKVTHIIPEYKMNFDQILNKPFLVTSISWPTSTVKFTELWRLGFPAAIMSNALSKVPFQAAAFFQAKMCCMLQVSGTPMHQGLILAAALPHGTPAIVSPNQILAAPHVFLNATESTSVCLECPMYTPCNVYRTNDGAATVNNYNMSTGIYGSDVFDLVFFVMDPLNVSSGSSTTISISVHCLFKEAEFFVPKIGQMSWQAQGGEKKKAGNFIENLWKLPTQILDSAASGLKIVTGDLIDYGRKQIKSLTGFHNPNKPEISTRMLATFRNFPNNVDQPVHLEVLDNHSQFSRIYDDFYFRTDQDEMDLKFLTSKPVFVGKFSVLSTDIAGKNLFAYPMTPMVEATAGSDNTTFYSPLRTIYEASRYWRGDLKMHIQAVCTNFHFCKIVVLKNYAMSDGPVRPSLALVPAYNNIHNLNTDTLEFSAGGQIQTIDLKYNSAYRQLECTKDNACNAINHGMAYGYLVQPLTYNSNVPTTITFNVYISGGDNLQFSGYSLDPINVVVGTAPTYPGVPNFFKNSPGVYEIVNNFTTGKIIDPEEIKHKKKKELTFVAESLEHAQGVNALVKPSSQDELLNTKEETIENISMAFRPNTSVRDYLRRMYPLTTISLVPTATKNVITVDVHSLVNQFNSATFFQAFSSLYVGISGGFKLKFKIIGATCGAASFVPPSTYVANGDYLSIKSCGSAVPTDAPALANFQAGMTFIPNKSFSAPQIEMQDYTRPYTTPGTTSAAKPGNVFVLEMAIPNMNMNNFVGSAAKWFSWATSPDPENDFGTIYLNLDASFDGVNYGTISVIPFIGLNDEARLGFQVYSPAKTIPTFLSTTPITGCRISVYHPPTIPGIYPNGIPVTPLSITGSCYYFNTT